MTMTPQLEDEAVRTIITRLDDLEVQALLLRAASNDNVFSPETLRVWKLTVQTELLNLRGWINTLLGDPQ